MNLTDKLPKPSYDDTHPGVWLNASPGQHQIKSNTVKKEDNKGKMFHKNDGNEIHPIKEELSQSVLKSGGRPSKNWSKLAEHPKS